MASCALHCRNASGHLGRTLKGHKTQGHRWKENIEDFISSSSVNVNYINFLIIIDCSRLLPEQAEVSVLKMERREMVQGAAEARCREWLSTARQGAGGCHGGGALPARDVGILGHHS